MLLLFLTVISISIQVDSYGEIFYQIFQQTSGDTDQSHDEYKAAGDKDVTLSAGMGSHDLKPRQVAIETMKSWIATWEKQTKTYCNIKGRVRMKDLTDIFDGM